MVFGSIYFLPGQPRLEKWNFTADKMLLKIPGN